MLNELTLPGADAIRADARRFHRLVASDTAKARTAALFRQGLQTRGPLELDLGCAAVRDHFFRGSAAARPSCRTPPGAARIKSGQRVSVTGKGAVNARLRGAAHTGFGTAR